MAPGILNAFPPAPQGNFTVAATPTSQPVTQGGTITYSVTVTSQNGFTGSVGLFALNLPGNQVLPGTGFNPQTVNVPANGSAQSTLTIVTNNQTPTGNATITIEGRHAIGNRSATVGLTVNLQGNFTVTASPASQSVTQGGTVTYNVTVTSQNGFSGQMGLFALNLPGNQVLPGTGFNPQTVNVPANGSAQSTLTIVTNTQTPTGNSTITIEGRHAIGNRSTTVGLTVNPPPGNFTVVATPASQSVAQGGTVTYNVTVSSQNGFSGSVGLFALNLPGNQVLPGTGFNPQTVNVTANGSAQSTLTIVTNSQTPTGNATITIEGRHVIGNRSATVGLTVNPPSAPTLSRVTPLSTPVPGIRFFARLEGGNFDPNAVEVIVVGVGCPNVGACIVPNSALKSGGVNATTINSAPFTITAGTFDIYVRNSSGGALSGSVKLTVNPVTPTPTIRGINFSTTPLAGRPFTAILEGSSFDPGTIQAIVTGPNCSPCLRENNTLGNKSNSKVEVPLTLNDVGTFQITLRNGSSGTQSNSKTINVVQQPPATFELSVLVAIADKQWPLDRADRIFLDLTNKRTGLTVNRVATNARYTFSGLTSDQYDLFVTVEYTEPGNNSMKPDQSRQIKYKKADIQVNASTEVNVLLPPIVVMVHGILIDFARWGSWQQYLNGVGLGEPQSPKGFITLQPDYGKNINNKPDTSVPALGGWEAVVQNVIDQLNASLTRLTSNTGSWPPIVYIGHSQGGLVGRVLLSGNHWRGPIARAIKRFYMLGTPNSGGIPSFGESLQQYFGYLNHDAMMKDFNVAYPDLGLLDRSKVKVFAGNQFILGDGAVPIWSVYEVRQKFCGNIPISVGLSRADCSEKIVLSFTGENVFFHHTELGGGESLDRILVQEIIPEISNQITAFSNVNANRQAFSTDELSQSSQTPHNSGAEITQTQSALVTMRRIYSTQVALSGNEARTMLFAVGASDILIVNAYAGIGSARYDLLTPAGQIVIFGSNNGEIESFNDEFGEWFVLKNPTPGQWNIRITAGQSNANIALAILESSPVGFQGYVIEREIQQEQSARLLAKWVGDTVAISAPSVVALVRNRDGSIKETVIMLDDGAHDDGVAGDGIFGATTSNLSAAGRYIVSFRAQGIYQSHSFTREASDRLDVLSVSHLFTGQFADAMLDSDADGKADVIQVTAPVNIVSAGKYLVTADLYDAQGYFIDRATTFLEANNLGLHLPKLDFDVSQTNCDQFSQAFSVRNIRLSDAATFRVWDQWTALVTTRIFDGQSFGCVTIPTGLQITAIQPNSIVIGDAAQVRISGNSFANGARLSLGSGITIGSVTLVSSDLLIAQITADAGATAGLRDVTVTNPDGRSTAFSGGFAITSDQPPSVAITYPSEQQVIRGQVIVSASAIDDKGIQRVEFFLGGSLALTDTSFPYQFEWDTRTKANGQHTLSVRAYDSANQSGSAQINVVASNTITSVSAASYIGTALASESIAAIFGTGLATNTQTATSLPLPTTLAGSSVKVKDGAGTERLAPLFFVNPGQINYQLPPGTADGLSTLTVTTATGLTLSGSVQIQRTAPGLFSTNATGQGVAAAVALRVKANGAQTFEPVAQFDATQNRYVSLPIDLGPSTDQVFLILFGTGWRFRSGLFGITAQIGGVNAEVSYAGPQGSLVGLDQLNVRVPRSLAGRGEVDISLTVDGRAANLVRVSFR